MTTFEHELEVRFRDCDGLGHVNNAVYLTYLEQARFAFWQRLTGVSGIPRSFIVARVECDYWNWNDGWWYSVLMTAL